MSVITKQQTSMIGNGNGYLQIGTALTNLQELGSLEGNSVETITRELLPIEDGEPKLLIENRVIRESIQIACALKEKRLRDVCTQLGLASTDVTDEISADVAITNEQHVMYDDSWVHLYGMPVKSSPALTADDGGATPISYSTTTDLEVNKDLGMVRRLTTGTIANGATVYFDYTYTMPKRRKLVFGGRATTLNDRYLRFVYMQPNNAHRDITEYPKASPGPSTVQNYNSGALNTRELQFTAIADLTAAEGSRLKIQYQEGSDIVA